MMKRLLALKLALVILTVPLCLAAFAGEIESNFAAYLETVGDDDFASAIIFLQDRPDIKALDATLHNDKAPMRVRHETVLGALTQAAGRSQPTLLSYLDTRVTAGTVKGYTPYWITNMVVVYATKAELGKIAQRGDVEAIEANFRATVIESAESSYLGASPLGLGATSGLRAINAPRVWHELGYTGEGTLVANLDTGVDVTHPALEDRWRGNWHPWTECWRDVTSNNTHPVDLEYHGTHVMGTICGSGHDTGDSIGIAFDALWIADRSLNEGLGTEFDNAVIGAYQWFADPDSNPSTTDDVPDVVQNSWGLSDTLWSYFGYVDCDYRWQEAIDNCEAAGVVLIFSAGNEGPGWQTHRSPANICNTPMVNFSVGAVDCENYGWPYPIAGFSSRGPSDCDSITIKPEVTAPGVDVRSCYRFGEYGPKTGTSMAGPHVAGVVALMRQANPDADVQTIKNYIMQSVRDLGPAGEDNTYGWGVIDAYEAVLLAMTPAVVSVSPAENNLSAPVSADISVTFNTGMNASTITGSSFIVNGWSTGPHPGAISYDSGTMTATFDPAEDFDNGEVITIVLTTAIESAGGRPLGQSYAWSFTGEVDAGSGQFDTGILLNLPNTVNDVCAADLDGDGDLDLATAHYYDDIICVLKNNGNGTYAAYSSYAVGGIPHAIVAADFDGDGDIDLAVPNHMDHTVTVRYNSGAATFPSRSDFSAGTYPRGICAADFDCDGDIDLATGNGFADSISVIFNNGAGAFTSFVTYPAQDGPRSITAADLDGDGDVDLATSNEHSDSLSVFYNDGSGVFPSRSDFAAGDAVRAVRALDLDGDGDLDLAAVDIDGDDVCVVLNNGSGTFGSPSFYPVINHPVNLFGSDLDDDGDIDLAAANKNQNVVSVIYNNGDATFSAYTTFPVGYGPGAVFAADVDDDGDMDLAVANEYSHDVSVLDNLMPPPAPTLYSPSSGTETTNHAPNLDWLDVSGFEIEYRVQVDNNSDFSSPERDHDTALSSWTVYPSLGIGVYYWRVRADNPAGPGPWSDAWYFVIYEPPPPSCPVLYSFDGSRFVMENTLLTACEYTGYAEAVTDYYHVSGPVAARNGRIEFQLRELEDEITYLDDIRLITVGHDQGTRVGCSVDGEIYTYSESLSPLAAVDHRGIDRIEAVKAEDGVMFTSDGPGHLVLTFSASGEDFGVRFNALAKDPCPKQEKEPPGGGGSDYPDGPVMVEVLTADGDWAETSPTPTRANTSGIHVVHGFHETDDTGVSTVRISWEEGFSVDVITSHIPSGEAPDLTILPAGRYSLTGEGGVEQVRAGFPGGEPLELVKGDILEFGFNANDPVEPGKTRDYIIMARGRYQPDYSVYTHLVPGAYWLHDCRPNPFSRATMIGFDLPGPAHVRLDIFNVLGQHVVTLIDEPRQAGMHEVDWTVEDGSTLASGVYFYQLSTDDYTSRKKVFLLR